MSSTFTLDRYNTFYLQQQSKKTKLLKIELTNKNFGLYGVLCNVFISSKNIFNANVKGCPSDITSPALKLTFNVSCRTDTESKHCMTAFIEHVLPRFVRPRSPGTFLTCKKDHHIINISINNNIKSFSHILIFTGL